MSWIKEQVDSGKFTITPNGTTGERKWVCTWDQVWGIEGAVMGTTFPLLPTCTCQAVNVTPIDSIPVDGGPGLAQVTATYADNYYDLGDAPIWSIRINAEAMTLSSGYVYSSDSTAIDGSNCIKMMPRTEINYRRLVDDDTLDTIQSGCFSAVGKTNSLDWGAGVSGWFNMGPGTCLFMGMSSEQRFKWEAGATWSGTNWSGTSGSPYIVSNNHLLNYNYQYNPNGWDTAYQPSTSGYQNIVPAPYERVSFSGAFGF